MYFLMIVSLVFIMFGGDVILCILDIDSVSGIILSILRTIGITVIIALLLMKPEVETIFDLNVYCEENHIAPELVLTIAETTNHDPEEIALICKYAADSGYDVGDMIWLIDGDLSEEEVGAIITLSDFKQDR